MASQKRNIDDLLADPNLVDWVSSPNQGLEEYWEKWLATHPERATDLKEAKTFLQTITFTQNSMPDTEKESLLHTITQEIDQTPNKRKGKNYLKIALGLAASIAIAVAAWMLIDWDKGDYAVPFGAIEKIELPDGSKVTLNANSKLHFKARWKKETIREVWLEGEAFFEVNPTPTHGAQKFVVHTNRGEIVVLGTSFNVKDREGYFSVLLTEGAVALTLAENAALEPRVLRLQAGDMVNLDVKTKTHSWAKPNTEVYTSWVERKLVCDNTTIAYLALVIEEQYGYEVILKDEALAERKLTGTLNNPGLEDLIQAISLSFNIKVEKTADRELTISY